MKDVESRLNSTMPLDLIRQIINCSPNLVWLKDLNGRYILCNDAFCAKLGKPLEEIVGATHHDMYDPAFAENYAISDKMALESGKPAQYDHYEIVNDSTNQKEWFTIIKSPIYDENKNIIALYCMSLDLTSESEARNQLSLISLLFNHSSEGMIITDENADIMNVNQAFTDITGYTKQEVLGQNPRILQSKLMSQDYYENLWSELQTNGHWKGELLNRRKNGVIYPQLSAINQVKDKHNRITNYFGVFSDISERKRNEEKLYHLAFYNELTDLPNRTYLFQYLTEQLESGQLEDQSIAVIALELDQFKHLNQTIGHRNADIVLQRAAERLKKQLNPDDFISHVNEDQFCILVRKNKDIKSELHALVTRFSEAFSRPLKDKELTNSVHLSTSLGVAILGTDGSDADTLVRNAYSALEDAKTNGRNTYAFYRNELTTRANRRLKLHSSLRAALENDEFKLVYQPQHDLVTKKLLGFEALIRWNNDELGFVGPDEFIPVAEQTGFIMPIGAWVLETAFRQGKEWLDKGYDFGRIAVNVSAIQLQKGRFVERLQKKLDMTGIPPENVTVEITEGILLEDTQHVIEQLKQLRAMGIEIALDDFGTGYSSLSYLKGLPIDKLKIDRSFIMDIPQNQESNVIVKAIAALANSMGISVIVEGIEDHDQLDTLIEYKCQYGQGYFLGRPLTVDDASGLLKGLTD